MNENFTIERRRRLLATVFVEDLIDMNNTRAIEALEGNLFTVPAGDPVLSWAEKKQFIDHSNEIGGYYLWPLDKMFDDAESAYTYFVDHFEAVELYIYTN